MNDIVKKYLTEKYGLENPEDRVKADYESQMVNPWAAFASGIGQTLSKQPVDMSWVDKANSQAFDRTVGKLERDKKDAITSFQADQEFKKVKEQEELDNRLLDQNSVETKGYQTLAKRMMPSQDFSSLNGKQILSQLPTLERLYKIESDKQDRASARADKRLAQVEKIEEKKQKQGQAMLEVADRYKNIKSSVRDLNKLVEDYGTYEAFGPENKKMEQHITSIATDMAKLVDPQSVARESEVETFKKMLFEPGFWQRQSTVKGTIDNFEKMVDERLENAYTIRGLQKPAALEGLNSKFPMKLKKGNQEATVSNEQELKEAKEEGWN